MKRISPGFAHKLSIAGSTIIDVSTSSEFNGIHLPESINYPLDKIVKDIQADNFSDSLKNKILLTCQSGNRAQIAYQNLQDLNFDVQIIDGGNQAWVEAGLPVIRGEGVISLERQIRIVAGGIGLAGSILSYLVSPGFILIPTIIGAGLLNAGLTNWCGMGMLLAKMPWNNSKVVSCDTTVSDYT